jgi:peroxiredoxin
MALKQPIKIGDLAPELALSSLRGETIRIADFRSKRIILFSWAPWCHSREQLVLWQNFFLRHRSPTFVLLGVSLDVLGGIKTREFINRAGITFPCLLDEFGAFWDAFGFNLTPAGVYIDETGRVRFLKPNAFNLGETTTAKILEDLLAEKWSKKVLKPFEKANLTFRQEMALISKQLKDSSRGMEKRFRLIELMIQSGQNRKAAKELENVRGQSPKNIRALHIRGILYLREKRQDLAIATWRQILQLDPAHWIARRQLWSLEQPAQFYPEVNLNWQREQLRLEELQLAQPLKAKAKAR